MLAEHRKIWKNRGELVDEDRKRSKKHGELMNFERNFHVIIVIVMWDWDLATQIRCENV